jgi:DnaJ-class molecular chaperone
MKNPYTILGIEKNSSDDDIKKAYRVLAKKYHPDLNPGNKDVESKFKEISVAYKLIENKEARDKYEKGIFDEEQASSAFNSRPFYNESQDEGGGRYTYQFDGNVEDIFKSFFSGLGGDSQDFNVRGRDHLYQMEIDLKDAVKGVEQEITLPEGKRLKVKIPAGIGPGEKMRFKNQGAPGIGKSSNGDAYVEILIRPPAGFVVKDLNLEIEILLNLDEAVNGTKISVPAIEGTVLLTIPPGVKTGSRFRIKEKGIPAGKEKKRGDQIVIVRIVMPDNPDAEFREFIKTWSEKHPYNPRDNQGGGI